MVQAPIALGMTLCERMEVDSTRNRVNLVGLFNAVFVDYFPSPLQDITVFLTLTDGRGEGELRLEIFELGDQERGRVIYRYRKWIRFPEDPLAISTALFPVSKLQFFRPGDPLLSVTFDGKDVTDRRLAVFMKGSGHGP